MKLRSRACTPVASGWSGSIALAAGVAASITLTASASSGRGEIVAATMVAAPADSSRDRDDTTTAAAASHGHQCGPFRRIATFPVFLNTDADLETVAEIVASAYDGHLLVYTDSATENIGFVDITVPDQPVADGVVSVAGEPTSVAVKGRYALAAVNTSADFINTSGLLQVIDSDTRTIVRSLELGGQPDAIAVSPDGRYAAIAIENERDEDLGNGEPPQAPPGFVVIVDLVGDVRHWSTRVVDLVGVPDLFPEDPEPEYVDINELNVAVVTLQENNHVVFIRLSDGRVVGDFTAGTVDLHDVDTVENDLIEPKDALQHVPREPDGVTWTSLGSFATADEGDLFGGSRGFTVFKRRGGTFYQAGNSVEQLVTKLGHYPEDRSENKGNEPESVEFGRYGWLPYLFVGSERSNVVAVYRMPGFLGLLFGFDPRLVQVLPTGVGPEGLLAIPERDLFVAANEVDDRGAEIRSSISIYEWQDRSTYPTVDSGLRDNGQRIPWGALSALAADPHDADAVYSAHDSFYRNSRIYTLDVHRAPATITDETILNDADGVLLGALDRLKADLPNTDDFVPADIVEDTGLANLDIEGVAVAANGDFWVASEGAGNLADGVSDPENRPFESPNLIIRVDPSGTIESAVALPIELVRNQFRFGFEGVASVGDGHAEVVYVAFQRAWTNAGDSADRARLGRYEVATGTWTFALYPLDAPTSPNGGWVGLSEITPLANGSLAVIERDNQGGPDARIKRVYTFSLDDVRFRPNDEAPLFEVIDKTLARDLIAEGDFDDTGGFVLEKLEGLAVLPGGRVLIVNDNDGVDDNNGETQLLELVPMH